MFRRVGLLLVSALSVAGCGGGGNGYGGGGNGTASCTSITGGGTAVSTSISAGCANCSISNEGAAADGDLSTSATMTVNNAPAGQGAAIRVTAQGGVVFPAGQRAGAVVSVPSGTAQNYTVTIRTYLTGALQESDSSDNSGGGCGFCGGHGFSFDGFTTTKQFDAVEVFINNTQAGGTPNFGVAEVCSDG